MSNLSLLPGYLQEISEDKPSANIKLLSVWNDLSVESQILVIQNLGIRFPNSVRLIALENSNEYIRYLIVKNMSVELPGDLKDYYNWHYLMKNTEYPRYAPSSIAVMKKIFSDPSPLVRGASSIDPSFWENSKNEKLRTERYSFKDELSKWINLEQTERVLLYSGWWFLIKVLEEIENDTKFDKDYMCEVIEEYLKLGPKINFPDNPERYQYPIEPNKILIRLWEIAAKEGHSRLAFTLVSNLPSKTTTSYNNNKFTERLITDIPNIEILKRLDNELLKIALYREDILISNTRKEIVFYNKEKFDDGIVFAAASANLHITHEDFSRIKEEKNVYVIQKLKELDIVFRSPVVMPLYEAALAAISNDLKVEVDKKYLNNYVPYLETNDRYSHTFRNSTEQEKIDALIEFSIYRLAQCFSHDRHFYSVITPEIKAYFYKILKGYITLGDTWGTFIRFYEILSIDFRKEYKYLLLQDLENFEFFPSILRSKSFLDEKNVLYMSNVYISCLENQEMLNKIELINTNIKKISKKIPWLVVLFAIILGIILKAH